MPNTPTLPDHAAYRPDIDGLRAVAVVSVVAFHAFPGLLTGGFVGVDVFFVISGYLIGGIILRGLARGTFTFRDFYARRVRRIFPALIIVLAASLAVGWAILLPDEFEMLGKHTLAAAAFVANLVFDSETGYFDVASELKPLLHLWSLGIEEQFYLFLPPALLLLARLRVPALPVLIALTIGSFAWSVIETPVNPVDAFFLPTTRFWELFIGCVLAALELRLGGPLLTARVTREAASAIGAILLAGAVLLIHPDMPFPGWIAIVPTMGTALLIAAGAEAMLNRRFLSLTPVVFVGLVSYPFYLWHWPLLSFARIELSGEPSIAIRSVLVAASFILAVLTYILVERPIRRAQRGKTAVRLVGAAVVVGLAGLLVFRFEGNLALNSGHQLAFKALRDARDAATRSPECHFDADDQSFAEFRKRIDTCLAFDDTRPNILVFGDSHGADTWMALSMAWPEVNFLQATGASCMPAEEHYAGDKERREGCAELIKYVKYEFPDLERLDGIVFAARWRRDFTTLAPDVAYYTGRGIPSVVFGPTFQYTADLPRIVFRAPDSLDAYLDPKVAALDKRMAAFFAERAEPYVSKIATLCSDGHCPALGASGEPNLIDYGHWSPAGAAAFGEAFRRAGVLDVLLGEDAVSAEGGG